VHILSSFPFRRVIPAIIHWEVKHLTKTEREDCLDHLTGFGNRFALSAGEDMVAVLDRLRAYAETTFNEVRLSLRGQPSGTSPGSCDA
jgi:hypothetical protein